MMILQNASFKGGPINPICHPRLITDFPGPQDLQVHHYVWHHGYRRGYPVVSEPKLRKKEKRSMCQGRQKGSNFLTHKSWLTEMSRIFGENSLRSWGPLPTIVRPEAVPWEKLKVKTVRLQTEIAKAEMVDLRKQVDLYRPLISACEREQFGARKNSFIFMANCHCENMVWVSIRLLLYRTFTKAPLGIPTR